jgi:hypothetical protein
MRAAAVHSVIPAVVAPPASGAEPKSARRPLSLFVLIDALGWSLLKGQNFLTDFLPYRQPVRTVLGFSSGAIPTILTGLAPARHGHWNLFYYDPDRSPFRWLRTLRFLPNGTLDNRYARRAITELGRRVLGLGPLFECTVSPRLLPWFNWVEKRDIYDRGGVTEAPSFFDELAERGISFRSYTYRRWTDHEILRRAESDLACDRADVLFLYLSELDRFLHGQCNDRQSCAKTLERYDDSLRTLFHLALERDPQATLAVLSDHGMTPVRCHQNVAGQIRALGFRMPEDYLAVYDSTMARFWFFRPDARRAISRRLSQIRGGRILDDEELQRLGVFFPDRRYGELIFLLDPGCLLTDSDFHNGGWKPAGMHGYHPDDPDSDAVFLTNRVSASPIRSVADLHGFLLRAATRERMSEAHR